MATAEDRATIAAIERAETRADPTGQSRALTRHLPAIEDMIARGLLTSPRAAKLFDIGAQEMLIARYGAKFGIQPDRLIGRRPGARIPEVWWEKIRISRAAHSDEARIPFYCRMVAAGFRGASPTSARISAISGESPIRSPLPTANEVRSRGAPSPDGRRPEDRPRAGQGRQSHRPRRRRRDAAEGKLGIGEAADLLHVTGQMLNHLRLGLRHLAINARDPMNGSDPNRDIDAFLPSAYRKQDLRAWPENDAYILNSLYDKSS